MDSIDTSNFVSARVFIEDPSNGIYMAHLDPAVRWNGWACPYFDFDEASRMAGEFAGINPDEEMAYDPERDCFFVSYAGEGGDVIEEYYGVDADGEVLYPIGNALWIWTLLDEA